MKPKKRVSFASTLSQAKSTDDILGESVSPSAGPPSPKKRPKGILRTQNKRNTPSQQFKRKSAAEVDRDGGEQQTSSDSNAVDENSSQRQATNKRSRMDGMLNDYSRQY